MSEIERRARRLLVIHNPTAGLRAGRRFVRWLAALDRLRAAVTIAETTGRGHAAILAGAADPARFDAVAVAGGDGTINEAVNGLGASPLPLAILPLGTANVLANELCLPRNIEALARIAAFAPARPVWPGELLAPGGGVPWRFLLMAGVGFDAEVVEHLDLTLKQRIGKGAYVAGSLAQLARYRPCRYRALLDGVPVAPASLVIARAHYYGGRFVLAPTARLEERGLHAVLFEQPTRAAMLRYLAAVVMGRLGCQCDVRVLPAARIELYGPPGAPVQVDGDIRARLPLSVQLAATPLNIIAAA